MVALVVLLSLLNVRNLGSDIALRAPRTPNSLLANSLAGAKRSLIDVIVPTTMHDTGT